MDIALVSGLAVAAATAVGVAVLAFRQARDLRAHDAEEFFDFLGSQPDAVTQDDDGHTYINGVREPHPAHKIEGNTIVNTVGVGISTRAPIDWAKPLELIDGTPLVLSEHITPQPNDGDYFLVRVDGKAFTTEQLGGDCAALDTAVFRPNGRLWSFDHLPVMIRNTIPAAANSNWPGLTDDQQAVLMEMSGPDFISYSAARLSERSGIPAKTIMKVRPQLRTMGLAQFGTLYDDCQNVCGKGYWLTPSGEEIKAHLFAKLAADLAA